MAAKKTTRIVLFPSHSKEYFVNPDLSGDKEDVMCLVDSQDTTIAVDQTFKEFQQQNCKNGCPYYFNLTNEARLMKDRNEAKTLSEAKDILKQKTAPDDRCEGTEEEARHACQYTDNFDDTLEFDYQILPSIMSYNPKVAKTKSHKLFLYKKEENEVMVKPYRLGNVKEDASICWGKNNKPKTLRSAWNIFWNSNFNKRHTQDLTTDYVSFLKEFDESSIERNWTALDLSEYLHQSGKKYDGVMYSNDPKIVEKIPEEHRHSEDLVVGWFYKANICVWVIEFNGFICVRDGKMSTAASKILPLGTVEELFH